LPFSSSPDPELEFRIYVLRFTFYVIMKLLISGYYGFRNAGDEAILAGMVEMFRAEGWGVTVLSADPAWTEQVHGVAAVDRRSWRVIRAALRETDVLVSGGGGLLQDATSIRSNLYYLGVLRLARHLGRRTMVLAQSIGPLQARLTRFLVRWGLRGVDAITVRDERSRRQLADLGLDVSGVRVTADPAFVVTPAPPARAQEILAAEGVPQDRPLLGVSLRPTENQARVLSATSASLTELIDEWAVRVLLFPFQPGQDRDLAAQAQAAVQRPAWTHVLQGEYTIPELLALTGQLDLLVGVRLHSLLFAAAQGVPFVGISYDPKVDGLLETFGQSPVGRVHTLTAADLTPRVREVWAQREAFRREIAPKVAAMRERAWENLAPLREWAG
jgi:polysaccharide pyruvyl transferase CsaB